VAYKSSKEITMIHNNDPWLRSFILQYLEQIEYWHVRFELSRDIEHLDNAEVSVNLRHLFN
jgi:hypothetical protein